MIEIRVNGCHSDRELGRVIKNSTQFFVKKLMPRKKRLKIIVQFVRDLLKTEGILGDCLADDFAVNGKHYEFILRIDFIPNDRNLMLSTLAHEMCHVKQYAEGTMRFDTHRANITIWKGEKFDSDTIPYEELPWEIDARKKEKALMSIFTYK